MLAALAVAGCSLTEDDPARINLQGGGVDGVWLDQSHELALAALGNACDIDNSEDETSIYVVCEEGPHAGLEVFLKQRDIGAPHKVEGIRVVSPFDGESKEGIRLGSTMQEVRARLGSPVEASSTRDEYLIRERHVYFAYEEGRVDAISMLAPLRE